MRTVLVVPAISAMLLVSCGGGAAPDPADAGAAPVTDDRAAVEGATGLRTVAPADAAAMIADPPDGLIVLDVRTPEEYAEGHLDDASLLDFYEPSFAADLATLDRDVPYVLYCRSGNRSGQALAMMKELGFRTVQNVDGGILAWEAAGLPVTPG